MSIREVVESCVDDGRLFELSPVDPGAPRGRRMFLSPDVLSLVETVRTKGYEAGRCQALRAQLDSFVEGVDQIGICTTPYAANEEATLGLLGPAEDGIWDFRSIKPKPGLRVIGGFACCDFFIALEWAPRSKPFLDRSPLGPRDSQEWRDIIVRAKAHWNRLLQPYVPLFEGFDSHEYVSENCHPV